MQKKIFSLFLIFLIIFLYKFNLLYSEKKTKISKLDQEIESLNFKVHTLNKYAPTIKDELNIKSKNSDIYYKDKTETKLNNFSLIKYENLDGFYAGIHQTFPGSGYLDFHENNLVIVSSRGITAYKNTKENKTYFKQIKNNIEKFINYNHFKKSIWFSIKDIKIINNLILISYTKEITSNCWNTAIIIAEMNYEYLNFKELFSPKKCINSKNNIDKEFNAYQSGGRIINFDSENILFSTGEYRSRHLAQNKNSVNGKILKININNSNYEIISMGHRNPQGLYFDEINNFILETEHGPDGGDEINLIEIDKIDKTKTLNYGWAIASYGEHYGGKENPKNIEKYKKYPLLKSHSENDFIEPLISFEPSIGISEISKINKKLYVVSSMKSKSLYFFNINEQKKITNLIQVLVNERIRDLVIKGDKMYLFLEDTASIAEVSLLNLSIDKF